MYVRRTILCFMTLTPRHRTPPIQTQTARSMHMRSKHFLLASLTQSIQGPTNIVVANAFVTVSDLRHRKENVFFKRAMSTNPDNKSHQSVRVVSYNLLSSHLAKPSYHTRCDPCNLKAEKRLPKLLSKLETELNQSLDVPVIFCLQEVSHDWASALHVFFAENGYHLVTALYGRRFNGYMGM